MLFRSANGGGDRRDYAHSKRAIQRILSSVFPVTSVTLSPRSRLFPRRKSKTYDAKDLFRKMDKARRDCLIPSELVPKCPVCGGRMEMNLRCDNYFVEDEAWHEAADRYADFLKQNRNKKVVLLELGVGFNTPIIIRFPFEKMVRENSSYSLIRLNMDEAVVPESFGKRAIGIEGDMERAITDIRGQVL